MDLGATGIRALLGTVSATHLELSEIYRSSNKILHIGGHDYWDIYAIFEHIVNALKIVAEKNIKIASIGIDTWGVDVVMVGKDGALLGLPFSYRDSQTAGAAQSYFNEVLSKSALYNKTGIQVMDFNTLFQLYIMNRNHCSAFESAHKILFMPDALGYLLTGKMVTEYTIASTSQFLNPFTKQLDEELLKSVGLEKSHFARLVMPGKKLGYITKDISQKTGLSKVAVVTVAGHDTASAVAAVPAENQNFVYLSSGTWSLMGIEVDKPIINDKAALFNITNEGGVNGTIRFLKNITGMWLLEQSMKEWKDQGFCRSYSELVEDCKSAEPFRYLINPDDPSFANPASMTVAISNYCVKTGQPVPQGYSEYARCIFESLAMRYRQVFEMFGEMAPFKIERLHVIGGGSKNELLNQFTANALGIEVVAGPSEATAIGNIMMQAMCAGVVSDLQQMRDMIAESVETKLFLPEDTSQWERAYSEYLRLTSE